MGKLEKMKKTSKLIGKIGKIFQVVFGVLAGVLLFTAVILFVVHIVTGESLPDFDYSNMGYWAEKSASEGRTIEAVMVFLISLALFCLMLAIIMHFIARIFKRFCNDYSPFLPEIVKDLKITSVLVTILILQSSIGLGIISGFIFWGIIQLYEYGCELQNQIDEIL